MKCKSWSHKINNFVVRRLKSIKINDQQQQTVTDTTSAAVIQQPCLPPSKQKTAAFTSSSTMPASQPKEKATAVSLNESNFSELKLKELTNAVITTAPTTGGGAAAAMGTTVTTVPVPPNNTNGRLAVVTTQPPIIVNSPKHQQQHNLSSSSASMSSSTIATSPAAAVSIQQHPSICGCGNISAADTLTMPHKYINNRHSSPLTAAMAAQSPILTARNSSPLRSNHMSCCRLRHNHANGIAINNNNNNNYYYNNNNSSITSQVTTSAVGDATTVATSTGATVATTTPAPATAPAAVTPPKKSPKDFIFGKYIGEGSFSMVYLAVDINTKREYAIKVCEKRQILREHKQEYIKREREVMHTMTGVPGFVSLSCTFQDTRSLYFVMTYAKNGDLLPYINKVGSFDVDCTRHYAAELVLACEQMHRRNIVHRDLKPENILLDEDMHTLIADFGSAKILTAKERESADEFLRTGGSDLTKKLRSQSGGSESGGSGSGGGASGDGDVVSCSTEEDEEGDEDDVDSTESSNDTASGGDDIDSPRYRRSHPRHMTRNHRKRKGSFVGTAQYVSPEVLQNAPITPAADLWALGCIIYQMMSGLPPFRGNTDYMIFKDIIACNLDFPQGFDEDAEDLVRKLLCSNPAQRLGAQDFDGCYHSIRSHVFFRGVDFDTVRQLTPPQICPFLPDLIKDEKFRLSEHLEPGLDDRQLSRLLGLELGCVNDDFMMEKTKKTAVAYKISNNEQNSFGQQFSTSCRNFTTPRIKTTASAKNSFDLTDSEKYERLEQQKSDKWHVFADGEVILRKGFVNKRKGLFARRRMLLLTTGPRLIYIDPVQMIKKGEIPWSPELRVEAKNFKIFFVHTPNRTYYLDDAEGYSLEWVAAIEKMHSLLYKEQTKQQQNNSTANDYNKTVIGNNTPITTTTTTTTTTSGVSTAKTPAIVTVIPKLTKTTSTISTRTLHKSASLLSAPFSMMKTASN